MRMDDSTHCHLDNIVPAFPHLRTLGGGSKISEEERKASNPHVHPLTVNPVSPSLWNSSLKHSQEGSVE